MIICFGGLALVHLTGFLASALYHGTKLVYVPVSSLAVYEATSSITTFVHIDGRKHDVGSRYAPEQVLADVNFWNWLDKPDLFSEL